MAATSSVLQGAFENSQSETGQMDLDDTQPVATVDMDVDVDVQPPIANLTRTGRPQRNYRLPRRFQDFLPNMASPEPEIQHVNPVVQDSLTTPIDCFGMWRDYPRRPTRDPDSSLSLDDLAENPQKSDLSCATQPGLLRLPNQPYWPFANVTIHRVMQWLNNGNTTKSEAQVDEFVEKVILAPDFAQDHLTGFDAHRENTRLDNSLAKSSFHQQFTESAVDILVPSGAVGVPPRSFSVSGLLHRKLTTVISDAFNSPLSHLFHFSPFRLYYKSPITKKEERVFGEIYTSDAFIEEHEKVQQHALLPPNDVECKREKIVAALMFSSDATHLAQFGSAKAWPIYLMLGNLSKYIRAKPDSGGMYHLAYIPSVSTVYLKSKFKILIHFLQLPDSFQDFASTFHCKWRTQHQSILTHCRRELMQGAWNIILDDDFIRACTFGIVVMCIDGIERRLYPRIFTYSADYPEK